MSYEQAPGNNGEEKKLPFKIVLAVNYGKEESTDRQDKRDTNGGRESRIVIITND